MDQRRVLELRKGTVGRGPVVYWMSREQRVADNWALLHAQEIAVAQRRALVVVFCLAPAFLGATVRHYGFMLRGLSKVSQRLAGLGIPFLLLQGNPGDVLPGFIEHHGAAVLVADFNPLRISCGWRGQVIDAISVTSLMVDGHNIVPCWQASRKQEYAASTFRPKIHRLLPEFLTEIPQVHPHPFSSGMGVQPVDWEGLLANMPVDRSVPEVSWLEPGEDAARRAMDDFLDNRLADGYLHRNDPNRNGQSHLSPYLHFGQLAPQRVALAAQRCDSNSAALAAFLEELIVRRELADNFCHFNGDYDRVAGFPRWARETLERHRTDLRPYQYDRHQLEGGHTHDILWNGAQNLLVHHGTMPGYLRMYWAKKILQWSPSPEEALETAIFLNDRYQLDGRDPNGYAGIAWSIGGVHDRPWPERPVFGTVRAMTFQGCRRKFDVESWLQRICNGRAAVPFSSGSS